MFAKLDAIEESYDDLERQLADPAIYGDQEKFRKVSKAHADMKEVVEVYRQHKEASVTVAEAKEMLEDSDEDIRAMAQEDLKAAQKLLPELEERLKVLLLPKDPLDEKNILLEIRAGTGGEEAALFAADLFRMYLRHAETKGWRVEIMDQHETGTGGFKEVIAMISGDRVYSRLKWESGTHRVQRVPATESQGRIHTSAVTVAVLPEAEEVEVDMKPEDLRIDVFRASGPGGQSVNTTDSAVRITHVPTGITVSCQDEKSQHKNKAKAFKILGARLLQAEQDKQNAELTEARRAMVGTGDRSGRIRTYNFPQNRVSEHRINLTLYSLDAMLQGDLDEVIEALTTHYQAEALKAQADVG